MSIYWSFVKLDCDEVLTKKDRFKSLSETRVLPDEHGVEKPHQLYVRVLNQKDFESELRNEIAVALQGESSDKKFPIKKPTLVEVIISVNMSGKRFRTLDVDNLAKTVLDCLKDIIVQDDSQVKNLLIMKNISEKNALHLALSLIDIQEESLFGGINIESMTKGNIK